MREMAQARQRGEMNQRRDILRAAAGTMAVASLPPFLRNAFAKRLAPGSGLTSSSPPSPPPASRAGRS